MELTELLQLCFHYSDSEQRLDMPDGAFEHWRRRKIAKMSYHFAIHPVLGVDDVHYLALKQHYRKHFGVAVVAPRRTVVSYRKGPAGVFASVSRQLGADWPRDDTQLVQLLDLDLVAFVYGMDHLAEQVLKELTKNLPAKIKRVFNARATKNAK